MRPRVLQTRPSVCQLCDLITLRNLFRPGFSLYLNQSRQLTTAKRTLAKKQQTPSRSSPRYPSSNEKLSRRYDETKGSAVSQASSQTNVEEEMREVISVRDKLISLSFSPIEEDVKQALAYCEVVAEDIIDPAQQVLDDKDESPASALLSLDEQPASKAIPKSPNLSTATQNYVNQLSTIAHSILLHPTILITPDLLRQYINLQSRLKKPETLPPIFKLYASKPMPVEGSSPVKYTEQNPNKIANAIDTQVADEALQSAIETKQLQAAMDIVDSAYATIAFRRNKFARKGLIPVTGLAVAPIAAYALASQLSTYQSTMEPSTATNIAFAGILAYMGFTAMLGIVAVTTANDQMDRITWNPGMPLRERWIREEERAAIDRIAGAWGFRETWRRGEEEGIEWEALREWVGRKGMILDRTELMEGME